MAQMVLHNAPSPVGRNHPVAPQPALPGASHLGGERARCAPATMHYLVPYKRQRAPPPHPPPAPTAGALHIANLVPFGRGSPRAAPTTTLSAWHTV